jgi:hypothetical protein
MINEILADKSPAANQALIGFTRYLSSVGLTDQTAPIFIKILKRNLSETSDILFKNRDPFTFFSNITLSGEMIREVLNILTDYKPNQIDHKIFKVCLGILQKGYKSAGEGFNIYPLRVADLHHIGKYLIIQEDELNNLISDLLDDIWRLQNRTHRLSCEEAKKIRDAFLDNTKRLESVIPSNLF